MRIVARIDNQKPTKELVVRDIKHEPATGERLIVREASRPRGGWLWVVVEKILGDEGGGKIYHLKSEASVHDQ